MPIYEYQCQYCAHEFERLQGISEAPQVECPRCEQPQLRLKLTAAAFHLKGTGWYETDFKNKDKDKDKSKKDSGDDKSKAESDSKVKDKPKSDAKSSDGKTSSADSVSNSAA